MSELVNCNYCNKRFKISPSRQKNNTICCSIDCATNLKKETIPEIFQPHSHKQIKVQCDSQLSNKCRREWIAEYRFVEKTKLNNNNKILCLYCARMLKYTGRNNPNCKYKNLDDNFFKVVDSEAKAYLLGWIASDGSITKSGFNISIHYQDTGTLEELRNIICKEIPITNRKQLQSLSVNSKKIAQDVCNLLNIKPQEKSHIVCFPELDNELLNWAFLRGYFDGDGTIKKLERSSSPYCAIASSSINMLESIRNFCKIPCTINRGQISWSGNNAIDFLSKLYDNANYKLVRKYNAYIDWCCWVPALMKGTGIRGYEPQFRWQKTRCDAVAPTKTRASDAGYDLTILEKVKSFGRCDLYTTGIKVLPDYGIYFDLVPRSSIIKTGYILGNSMGIIDRTYVGEILVPLIKIDHDAPDLALPNRIVQIIPRIAIHINFVAVKEFEETARADGGFGSTGV